jgi:hypothetical protein
MLYLQLPTFYCYQMTVTFHPASGTLRLLATRTVIPIESLLELFGPEGRRTNYFETEGTAYDPT